MTASLYRIFKRVDTPSVRSIVIALVVVACTLTAVGVIRVTRQHEVLRLGYQLSREAQHVGELREVRRRLELERGTLTSPDRIRRLATQLGMTSVAPDKVPVMVSGGPPKISCQSLVCSIAASNVSRFRSRPARCNASIVQLAAA